METRTCTCYLIVSPAHGNRLTIGVRKSHNISMSPNAVAIRLDLSLPASLFTRPQFSAKVEISPDRVTPQQVSAEVVNNIEATIKAQTGIDVKLELVQS